MRYYAKDDRGMSVGDRFDESGRDGAREAPLVKKTSVILGQRRWVPSLGVSRETRVIIPRKLFLGKEKNIYPKKTVFIYNWADFNGELSPTKGTQSMRRRVRGKRGRGGTAYITLQNV